jgi:hypothetical protein
LCEGVLKTLRGHLFGDYTGVIEAPRLRRFASGPACSVRAVFGRHSRDPRRDDARGRDGGGRQKVGGRWSNQQSCPP